MRTITISGRLGADAVVKKTQNGREYLQFRMASQEYGDENPIWANVVSFNAGDIKRSKWFTQGKPVNVIGTFKPTAYVSRQNSNVAGLDVNAFTIEWISTGQNDSSSNSNTAAHAKAEPAAPSVVTPAASQPQASPSQVQVTVNSGPSNPFTQTEAGADDDLPF